jgi:sec-independent protein translocase protein TatC
MAKEQKDEMSFLEHLEELRWHLIRSVISILFFAIAAFAFHTFIFDKIILAPKNADFFTNRFFCHLADVFNTPGMCINNKPFELININMAGQFNMHVATSMVIGLIISFPYIFWEFWSFIAPALKEKEKRYSRLAVLSASVLFMTGVLFGYYLIIPITIHFFGSYSVSSEIVNQIQLTSYISTFVSVTLWCGIIFEMPIIVYFFSRIGLLTPTFMRKYRRHAIIVILIIAAVITPPDIFSQIIVSVPLIMLYEISIYISAYVLRKKERLKNA